MLLYQLGFVLILATLLIMTGFHEGNALFYAVLFYFIIFYIDRSLLTYKHRMGIRSYRKQRYEEAIEYFRESAAFFKAHPQLDRFRWATLFSISKLSYREIAETNAGFCLFRLERYADAEQAFRRAQEINPDNPMVPPALKALSEYRK